MVVSVCTDTLLYLTWMPDCGAPVRIVTYYAVEFLAVYMLMSQVACFSCCSYYVFISVGLSVRSVV
jgi:hypothetical protein